MLSGLNVLRQLLKQYEPKFQCLYLSGIRLFSVNSPGLYGQLLWTENFVLVLYSVKNWMYLQQDMKL